MLRYPSVSPPALAAVLMLLLLSNMAALCSAPDTMLYNISLEISNIAPHGTFFVISNVRWE